MPRVTGLSWLSSVTAAIAMAIRPFSSTRSSGDASASEPGSVRPVPARSGASRSSKSARASEPSATVAVRRAVWKPTPLAVTSYVPGGTNTLASPCASVSRSTTRRPAPSRISTWTLGSGSPPVLFTWLASPVPASSRRAPARPSATENAASV